MIFFSFIDDLVNKFNGQIPNLIFFAIGIAAGIILFLIMMVIIYIISKTKKVINKHKTEVIINEDYKNVISSSKELFDKAYKDSEIKEKISGICNITLGLMEGISSLYYPESDDPIFEISIERLVDFLGYFSERIDYVTDNLLHERFHAVEMITKLELKNCKLTILLDMLEKNKNVPEKKGIVSKIKGKLFKGIKKAVYNFGNNTLNYTFYSIIDDIGEDINKLYSNQELIFTQLSKKELKLKKKQEKKARRLLKRNVGDENA